MYAQLTTCHFGLMPPLPFRAWLGPEAGQLLNSMAIFFFFFLLEWQSVLGELREGWT